MGLKKLSWLGSFIGGHLEQIQVNGNMMKHVHEAYGGKSMWNHSSPSLQIDPIYYYYMIIIWFRIRRLYRLIYDYYMIDLYMILIIWLLYRLTFKIGPESGNVFLLRVAPDIWDPSRSTLLAHWPQGIWPRPTASCASWGIWFLCHRRKQRGSGAFLGISGHRPVEATCWICRIYKFCTWAMFISFPELC